MSHDAKRFPFWLFRCPATVFRPDLERTIADSKVTGFWLSPELGVFALAALFYPNGDQLEEVEEDQEIGCEQADADGGEPAEDFEDLPGQERGGDGEGHVFGPDLLKVEADSFDHAYGGVAEGDQSDAAQERVVEEFGLVEEEVDQARFGVEAQVVDEGGEFVANVFVEQMARAQADEGDEQRLEELVDRDEHEPIVMVAALCREGGDSKWGADHYLRGILDNH